MAAVCYSRHNNQPKSCGHNGEDVGEEDQPEGGYTGGSYSIVLAAMKW
jgi:hypothetical protein